LFDRITTLDYHLTVKELKGIPASPGIYIGKAYLHSDTTLSIPQYPIEDNQVEAEVERFQMAVEKSAKELNQIKDNLDREAEEQHKLLDSHLLMLYDPSFSDQINSGLNSKLRNVEWIIQDVVNELIRSLEATKDSYLIERSLDIHDISKRILHHLMQRERVTLHNLEEPCVVVTSNLLPSEALQMNRRMVKAIVMDTGGRTSHTAILARSLGIPTVLGLQTATKQIEKGMSLIVDGERGLVFVEPEEAVLEEYRKLQQQYEKKESMLFSLSGLPAETIDGKLIELKANLEFPEELDMVQNFKAEGIGLYRSEFLFLDPGNAPSEEEQYLAYSHVLETMDGKPVTIRTLDVGGDKLIPEIESVEQNNPLLGWRAIRFCLERDEIFRTQLRAMYRASVHGNLRIMFPLISGVEELLRAIELTKEIRAELTEQGVAHNPVPLGIMIEVPSAAMTSDILARKVDFFSIGTNDLIQYTLAIDRGNEKVASMYQPLHPAIIRMIKMVVDNAHQEGIPVSLCGEMAGDATFTVILVGLGLDEMSMTSYSLPEIKKIIRSVSVAQAEELLGYVLEMRSYEEINRYVRGWMEARFDWIKT
jgi:phosphotransferase system enzyme I (PtsI)